MQWKKILLCALLIAISLGSKALKDDISKSKEKACPICYMDFSNVEMKIEIPCQHEFCATCFIKWFCKMDMPKCPICRNCMNEPIYSFITTQSLNFIKAFIENFPEALNDNIFKDSIYDYAQCLVGNNNLVTLLNSYFDKAKLLVWAIRQESLSQVNFLLKQQKVNPNITPSQGYYKIKINDFLKQEFLNPYYQICLMHLPSEDLPLNIAIKIGNLAIAQKLIEYGANVNQTNSEMETPIFLAVRSGNLNGTRLLLKNKANPNLSPLDEASDTFHFSLLPMGKAETEEMAQLLYENGAEVLNKFDDEGMNYLHYASIKNNVKLVQFLLKIWRENEINIDISDENFETPLSYAVQGGHEDTAKLLLQFESNANMISDGLTLLQHAIMKNMKNLWKELILHDAKPFCVNWYAQNSLEFIKYNANVKNKYKLQAQILKLYSQRINLKRKRVSKFSGSLRTLFAPKSNLI